LPSAPASDTAEQLVPVYTAVVAPVSKSGSTPVAFPYHDRAHVRTLRYAGDFIASSAMEGADGEFYLTYFWDMGSTAFSADRFGVLDGSAIRETFTGVFLDEITIVDEHDGFPVFRVDGGGTAHESDAYGLWRATGAGVDVIEHSAISYYSPLPHPCSWCYARPESRGPGYCAPFAGANLCDTSIGVTFKLNGAAYVVDKGAHLVGAGPHRFLIIERPIDEPPVYIEGFAASD
jgi:hypothetical protein